MSLPQPPSLFLPLSRTCIFIKSNRRSSKRDTTLDLAPAPPSDDDLNEILESSLSDNFASSAVEVNGDGNMGAYSSNQTIGAPLAVPPIESQSTGESTSFSEHQNDSVTTATDGAQPSHSPKVSPHLLPFSSGLDSSINLAVDVAVDDNTAISSIPPVIEAPESDLRDSSLPPAPAQDAVADGSVDEQALNLDNHEEGESVAKAGTMADSTILADANLAFEPPPAILSTSLAHHEQPPPQPNVDLGLSTAISVELENPNSTAQQTQDVDMADAPALTTKISREREDDTEGEPSAKRTKTEDEAPGSVAPEAPSAVPNGATEASQHESTPLSEYLGKEIVKILRNCLRTNSGKNFRNSVRVLWPNFADAYEAKISNPIDLNTMETKIKATDYKTIDAVKADVELIYSNSVIFNGIDHTVTAAAKEVRDSLLAKIDKIPAEPVVAPKAAKTKQRKSTPGAETPTRLPTARRPSRSAGTAAASAQTFALDPATSTPLIRRDTGSKEQGGRPKRVIHPPKNKDLPYSVRPAKKKYATELKFCEDVLNEVKKPRYALIMDPFLNPVDPVALGIPNYFAVIKHPMDISTITDKLNAGGYERAKNFEDDMRLIYENCFKFNPPGNVVRALGDQYKNLFDERWAKKDAYIQDHATPAAESPGSFDGESDEESEGEEVETQPTGNSAATLRLIEEQNKLITLMASKKTDPAIVTMQQDMVDFLKQKVDEENSRAAPAKKSTKKAKPTKQIKKAAPAKKAGGGGNKKGSNKKERYLGTLEKEIISAGLGELPDKYAGPVLEMIKQDQPDVDVCIPETDVYTLLTVVKENGGEIEVDIEAISVYILWHIYDLVMEHAPEVAENLSKAMDEKKKPQAPARPAPKKKNKPMNKFEQDHKIEMLKQKQAEYGGEMNAGFNEPVLPSM